jgi:AbiV family abortive infection protein
MLPRRLSAILQIPEGRRFNVLAEGMALLAENVGTLEADAATLGASRRDRGAAVLRSFAEEEAAKVLILLDLARAGWQDQVAVRACLSAFYSHVARGLYVRAYDGSPADLAEVRGYVDELRQNYYLDGPTDVDWIFRNEVEASREERLYVDYIEDEYGHRRWTGPADRAAIFDEPFSFPMAATTVVRLVAAMRHIGLLTEQGLAATRDAWSGVVVDDTMRWPDLRSLNVAAVESLADILGRAYAAEEDGEALRYVLEHWIFPLSSLDLRVNKVDLDDLRRKRERRLAREMGIADDFGPFV